jgi:hypothetical protein
VSKLLLLPHGLHATDIKSEASMIVAGLASKHGGPPQQLMDQRAVTQENAVHAEGPGAGAVKTVKRVITERIPEQVISRVEQTVTQPVQEIAIPWLHGHQPMSR